MAAEATLEQKAVKYLKSKGCFVVKMQAGPGVPKGTPDRLFCKEGFYGWLEFKGSKTAKFQPLQKERVAMLNEWSYARVVYPENWDEVQAELDTLL